MATFVINDPQVARAHMIEVNRISQAGIIETNLFMLIRMKKPVRSAYHITYILNGGENSISNREVYHERNFR